jgi:glycine/D-amino acid oxidase-like deaminating enzyme/nitrite reductase/ring-hydroxylating ferredoxin subunit
MTITTNPVWRDASVLPQAGQNLLTDMTCDVCVVGAGIAGLSTAYRLAIEGKRVTVLEAQPEIGLGETGSTSAHLSSILDDRFARLRSVRGSAAVRPAFVSHSAAIGLIEDTVLREGIACDFARVDGYLFPGADGETDTLTKEAEVCRESNIPFTWVDRIPWRGARIGPALRFPDQAEFHPGKYLVGLAAGIVSRGGSIYTGTRVASVIGGERVLVTTTAGRTVAAGAVVLATNSPINSGLGINSRIAAYTTYVLAAEVPPALVAAGLFWDTEEPYHFVRFYAPAGGVPLILVGGEDHKTGQRADQPARWGRLEAWLRDRFPGVGPVKYRWDGQVFETLDGLGHIGRDPAGGENVYVATGDSGMGLTHGTISGSLLTDLIQGRTNPWSELYDPGRFPLAAVGRFVRENTNMVSQYSDWLSSGGEVDPADLAPGQGVVTRWGGAARVAACRTDDGTLHLHSAVCPHYGGIVRWNEAEQTWDCPCHGSRFAADGRVLHGPATTELKPITADAFANAMTLA